MHLSTICIQLSIILVTTCALSNTELDQSVNQQHESSSTHKQDIIMTTKLIRYINQLKHLGSGAKSAQSFNLFHIEVEVRSRTIALGI